MNKLCPQICIFNETALKFDKKPDMKIYISFNKHRWKQAMGGVATLIKEEIKDSVVKLKEGI